MPISRELQAKIDALPYERLKADIVDTLNSPGRQTVTNEQIFENMVNRHIEVKAQRALREARMYRWRDDEVIAFIEHFKKEMPKEYAEYLQQERNGRQIDADLAWGVRFLAERWRPGIDRDDRDELFVKVRHYAQAHLI
ncbi:hypothetical protein [Variovorax paradoxus]|uniref:hypothetical protein n=1 Tax=Variovorax paradoxus TaxID=34073 RepID=UPI003D659E37